jgi:hypothetical protein
MTDRSLDQAAVLFLREHDFSAELVEETDTPTPDILATDNVGQTYVLEIKDRTVSWLEHSEKASARLGIDVRTRTDPTGPSNALSRVIKKAAEQLEAVTKDDSALRLLWFFANSTDWRYHYERIRHTVYGMKVVVATREGQSATREGIYVAPAAFVRWRNLVDGVLLGAFGGLLLNDLSPRYHLLKSSQLARQCGDAVLDPPREAELGQCYYLPPSVSSLAAQNVASRLEKIYNIKVAELMNLHRFSAEDLGDPTEDELA